ncbi:hypothetical protein C8R43DRAFT_1134851 [Mycena crocata]|nr:hypothetical protein C8R43DRAFT_1134851 [Mycena crocata]
MGLREGSAAMCGDVETWTLEEPVVWFQDCWSWNQTHLSFRLHFRSPALPQPPPPYRYHPLGVQVDLTGETCISQPGGSWQQGRILPVGQPSLPSPPAPCSTPTTAKSPVRPPPPRLGVFSHRLVDALTLAGARDTATLHSGSPCPPRPPLPTRTRIHARLCCDPPAARARSVVTRRQCRTVASRSLQREFPRPEISRESCAAPSPVNDSCGRYSRRSGDLTKTAISAPAIPVPTDQRDVFWRAASVQQRSARCDALRRKQPAPASFPPYDRTQLTIPAPGPPASTHAQTAAAAGMERGDLARGKSPCSFSYHHHPPSTNARIAPPPHALALRSDTSPNPHRFRSGPIRVQVNPAGETGRAGLTFRRATPAPGRMHVHGKHDSRSPCPPRPALPTREPLARAHLNPPKVTIPGCSYFKSSSSSSTRLNFCNTVIPSLPPAIGCLEFTALAIGRPRSVVIPI